MIEGLVKGRNVFWWAEKNKGNGWCRYLISGALEGKNNRGGSGSIVILNHL